MSTESLTSHVWYLDGSVGRSTVDVVSVKVDHDKAFILFLSKKGHQSSNLDNTLLHFTLFIWSYIVVKTEQEEICLDVNYYFKELHYTAIDWILYIIWR